MKAKTKRLEVKDPYNKTVGYIDIITESTGVMSFITECLESIKSIYDLQEITNIKSKEN